MNKFTILAASVLMSATAFASNQTSYSAATLTTDAFSSKQAAYEAGFDYVDTLADASRSQLTFELAPSTDSFISDIEVDGAQVKVEEFALAQGEVAYRAVVNVDYHYDTRSNSND